MKTTTGILLVLASAASAAVGAALTRRQGRATRLLAMGVGFAAPWGIQAAFASEPSCTVLFVTDTHGSAQANAPLVRALLRETGIDRVVLAGDVADRAIDFPVWWDVPFREVVARWPVDVASGNHDQEDAAAYAEFVSRFGEEPHSVVCGNAEFFFMPWGLDSVFGRWLRRRVEASTARWKVLVTHRPLWSTDGSGAVVRDLYAASLPYIDLVLAGHEHVAWDSVHEVDGHRIRQIIDVSGPKKYPCPAVASGCVEGETAYWRISFGDSIKATRKVVS